MSELPIGWRKARFEELVFHISDRVDDPKAAGVEVYVGLEHLDPGSLKIRRRGTPDDVNATKLRVKPGQIIFGKRRAYQRKVAVADFDGICSAHAMVLEANPATTAPGFLPFFMQSDLFFDRAIAISEGSLSPTIKWKVLAAQEFLIPPIDKQKEMVELFQAIEDAIAATEASIGAAEDLKQVLMSEMFTVGINNTKFKETKIGLIPETWELVALNDILVGSRYGTSVACSSHDGEYPVLRIPNVVTERLLVDDLKFADVSEEDVQRYSVQGGDILFVRTNGNPEYVGRGIVVPDLEGIWLFASYLIRIRLDPSKALPDFIHLAFQIEHLRKRLRHHVSTSAGNYNLNLQGLGSILVALPSLTEQQRIIDVLKSLFKEIEQLQIHKDYLQNLKIQAINSLLSEKYGLNAAVLECQHRVLIS